MSDTIHLQASDALLMQATFYANALRRERELREGQAQLLEQLRRQLKKQAPRDEALAKLVERVGEFVTVRSTKLEGREEAVKAMVDAYCEFEEQDEKSRGIDREEEYRNV